MKRMVSQEMSLASEIRIMKNIMRVMDSKKRGQIIRRRRASQIIYR